ncbi:MAG: AAA family ATPase [Symploca sp. SIO2D2]|nr:AAA family ATPase [Symploca sp. SIO2D2]
MSIIINEVQWISNIFQLSTGQSSLLNIALSILRDFDMSGAKFETLADVKGVVIIDEVDAHLNPDLQCNVLPALLEIFPKVQFILTTHSPLFLLGMKAKFGEDGFHVLELPSGNRISIEEFEEFQSAFEYYQDSSTFRRKIEAELEKSKKPVIFFEGDYDIKYLKKAASLLGEEDLLNSIELYDSKGFGDLDKIWKSFDNKLSSVLQKIVGLIYD